MQRGVDEHAHTCGLNLGQAALLPLEDGGEGRILAASREAVDRGALHAHEDI